MLGLMKGAWQYRQFILSSVRNDFVWRFSRSRFGAVWLVLQPLAMVLIYALILSAVLSAKLPGIDNRYAYAIYLTAGILPWTLFLELVNRCMTMFIDNAGLIKKIRFPKISLPLIVLGSALINYLLLLACALVVFTVLGQDLLASLLWLIPLTVLVTCLSIGLGLTLGVLNVFMRDVGQIMSILLQFLFWLTPIVYPLNIVPEQVRMFLMFNPLYHVVDAYHQVMVYGNAPDPGALGVLAVVSMALLGLGLVLFRKASAEMVDAL